MNLQKHYDEIIDILRVVAERWKYEHPHGHKGIVGDRARAILSEVDIEWEWQHQNEYIAKSAQVKQIIQSIFRELKKAEEKFPKWPTDMIHAAAIVNEESGELAMAALKWTYESGNINEAGKEAVQVAATAIRFLNGLQKDHYQPNPTFKAI